MASETKTENIMLTGQTAYFKKNGSMVNRGTLNLANALSSRSYAEGYIGPNSILHGTDLATTSEYKTCETNMKLYLEDHWTEKEGERSIITNSNVIKELLNPLCDNIQAIVDGTVKPYTEYAYIRSTGTQWIDTGIIPTNHYVVCKARLASTTADQVLFGTDNTGFSVCAAGNYRYKYANGTEQCSSNLQFPSSIYTYTYNKDNKFTINDCVIDDNIHAVNDTSNIYLCGMPNLGDNKNATLYIYYFKIYECGTDKLVREYIPVRDNNSVYCFYEKITDKLVYSNGTAAFSSGGSKGVYKCDLEYAETTNNSYIVLYGTGSTSATSSNGFELDFIPMEDFSAADASGEKYILCASNGTSIEDNYYIRICSYPGYPNGMIQIQPGGEMLDAKLQYGKRQKIKYRDGILTLPDGTTHNILLGATVNSAVSLNWRVGQSRAERDVDHSVVRIYNAKVYGPYYNILSDVKPILSNTNYAYFWNTTTNTNVGKSGNLKPGPRKES